jgi:two-component system nitrate/nitrite response regulator NarL
MGKPLPRILGLTARQWVMTRYVSEGMKNKEIAKKFHTTENVIKNHMRTIFDVTGMFTRLELALWYVKRRVSP